MDGTIRVLSSTCIKVTTSLLSYMSYTFTEQIVPPALLYRFLASFVVMRNINVSKDPRDLLLFTDSAVVSIDKDNNEWIMSVLIIRCICYCAIEIESPFNIFCE
jgi:hypothetical protein